MCCLNIRYSNFTRSSNQTWPITLHSSSSPLRQSAFPSLLRNSNEALLDIIVGDYASSDSFTMCERSILCTTVGSTAIGATSKANATVV
ncbi:hypothetical protein AAHA92_30123 [Salvia divinorum]|uniref:Uncharacterized protein n=1 Tax=Salvia divinorum TaxID=28513 RepID=A0ABD1G3R9_SALDI